MTTTDNDKLVELVEINLLYAQAELKAAVSDPSAMIRAVRHVENALKDIRAQKRAVKPKMVSSVAA